MIEDMRIAFVVNNYPPRVGGVESHVSSLAQHLRHLGQEVIVITLAEVPGKSVEEGIVVVRLKEYGRIGDVLGFPAPGVVRRVARILSDFDADVVSVHTRFFPMSWVGLRAATRRGVPVVHTEHGSGHVVSDSRVISRASRAVDRTMGRAMLRGADAILGVSEKVVDFVWQLSGRRATVFYNAIDEHVAVPRTEVRPARPEGAIRLVFVGRLVPGKGVDAFVQTVAALVSRGLDVTADVLGDGPERTSTERMIVHAGLSGRIRLRGRVGAGIVRDVLTGATLVNPTTLAEGFQTTLLEALAEGGRVVTYDVPGAALLADQGRPVLIVAEQSGEALADAVIAVSGAELSRAPMDEWFWPRRATDFIDVINRASASRRHRSA